MTSFNADDKTDFELEVFLRQARIRNDTNMEACVLEEIKRRSEVDLDHSTDSEERPSWRVGPLGVSTSLADILSRFFASLFDYAILALVFFLVVFLLYPLTNGVIASTFLYFLTPLYYIVFTHAYGATPGKKIMKIRVVQVRDGKNPAIWRSVVRYFGYWVSSIPFCLGFFWALWDKRNQTWHDKLAGTVVIDEPLK